MRDLADEVGDCRASAQRDGFGRDGDGRDGDGRDGRRDPDGRDYRIDCEQESQGEHAHAFWQTLCSEHCRVALGAERRDDRL